MRSGSRGWTILIVGLAIIRPLVSALTAPPVGDMRGAPCYVDVDDADKRDFLVFDGELREALTRRTLSPRRSA
jgi:hypothetical protein